MDEATKLLLDAHDKASIERRELMAEIGELREVVFNGLRERVARMDSRLWWLITAVVALNAASAVAVIIFG